MHRWHHQSCQSSQMWQRRKINSIWLKSSSAIMIIWYHRAHIGAFRRKYTPRKLYKIDYCFPFISVSYQIIDPWYSWQNNRDFLFFLQMMSVKQHIMVLLCLLASTIKPSGGKIFQVHLLLANLHINGSVICAQNGLFNRVSLSVKIPCVNDHLCSWIKSGQPL